MLLLQSAGADQPAGPFSSAHRGHAFIISLLVMQVAKQSDILYVVSPAKDALTWCALPAANVSDKELVFMFASARGVSRLNSITLSLLHSTRTLAWLRCSQCRLQRQGMLRASPHQRMLCTRLIHKSQLSPQARSAPGQLSFSGIFFASHSRLLAAMAFLYRLSSKPTWADECGRWNLEWAAEVAASDPFARDLPIATRS